MTALRHLRPADLRTLFERTRKNDPSMLATLAEELEFRDEPGMAALLLQVKDAQQVLLLAQALKDEPPDGGDPQADSLELFTDEKPARGAASEEVRSQTTPPRTARAGRIAAAARAEDAGAPAKARWTPADRADVSAPSAAPSPAPPPEPLTLDQACLLLKVSSETTWEAVEQSRYRLVELASPTSTATLDPVHRDQLRAEASRINEAYLRLLLARCTVVPHAGREG